ncbi:DUF1702 family protein [Paludisphaera mucosa]|uniref:DUF1702 family protein n=1 Tax=Paludisphaera mucosa TaxID=3030827 RepID=A0ABT6FLA6_9BACT|nr:DUF1702 family protein [Paludisphaera mucosa]
MLYRRFRRSWLGIEAEEAGFVRRGFREAGIEAHQRLESVGRVFIAGYNAALEAPNVVGLGERLDGFAVETRGFAYEGAAMAAAILDGLTPWGASRFRALLHGPGAPHVYMLHVGFGCALARLPWGSGRLLRGLDPLLGWLAVDGYGFHQGYFHPPRYLDACESPGEFAGYALRAFDQGLGRSLWFAEGADVGRIARRIGTFAPDRRVDLWAGVGLACGYAGGVGRDEITALRAACPDPEQLAQGAAFAAKARQRARNPAAHTELACRVLCGRGAEEAAVVTDDALIDLPGDQSAVPVYEIWRARIRTRLSGGGIAA